jgi:IS5 family transposase
VSDISQTAALLHGQESDVWADAGYVGVEKIEDMQQALNANEQTVRWHVAKRRSTIEKVAEGWQISMAQAYEKLKSHRTQRARKAPKDASKEAQKMKNWPRLRN